MQKVIERALNLLAFLLTAGRPVTADEIRTTVAGYHQATDEAFRRTFERDKDLLRRLGIPLEMHPTDRWEVEFGYVVPEGEYALPDAGLTDEERAALLLAAQAVRFGGQPAGPDALFKLGGAPVTTGGEPLAAELGADASDLGEVFAAVADRRLLQLDYRGSRRSVRAYGLVHKLGHWYVVGPEQADPDIVKAFRMDRAAHVAAGDAPAAFERPSGFRAADAVPASPWEVGETPETARVYFAPDVAWLAERDLAAGATITRQDDGGIIAELQVSATAAFTGWILGYEDHAEILEPETMREALIAAVRDGA